MPDIPSYPRRRHPRLAGYDYARTGFYFVTVCTQDRLPLFGSVESDTVRLTPGGEMVREAWRDIVRLHIGTTIDTHIVMPDHIHAIVVLEDIPTRSLSLPDVLGRYKSLTTKRYSHCVRDLAWPRFEGKLWQESFYNRGIRSDNELYSARRYILENASLQALRRTTMP